MGCSCGIVGLPNVGKSTLFNALLALEAANVQNYPFCTIEPNRGRIPVPNNAFEKLVEGIRPQRAVPNFVEIVDIAGLVRGASKGEGLGNKFLSHIREVDVLLHLVRCFSSSRVLHVEQSPDAERDADLLEVELLLADLARLEGLLAQAAKRARGVLSREEKRQHEILKQLTELLNEGEPARNLTLDADDVPFVRGVGLLSAKPMLYVCNVGDADVEEERVFVKAIEQKASRGRSEVLTLSAIEEAELAVLDEEERKSLLGEQVRSSGLERTAATLFRMLELVTFFTASKKEVRAWTLKRGQTAWDAAGKIHSDFQKGFICAETIDVETLLKHGSFEHAREAGKVRQEGKGYVVQNEDVFLFRFNV